ncbi:hypothetical protein AB2L27_16700 [Kineococcus sp. LSe6-4]|uniref:Oligosaccharide flippase family protein n=1 Tax=Kineococcus halophytocola TaxID=3234027 RepID=A0ABV4H4B4_9ACTN
MTRGLWNIADQVVSSGNNFLVQLAVAQFATAGEFGAFAIAFAVFSVTIGFMRALATTPVAIRFAASDDADFRRGASSAVGTTFLLSVVVSALVLLGTWALPLNGVVESSLVALAVVLPGLLVQDAWRQTLFARLRPAAATLLDAVWGLTQVVAVGALLLAGERTPVAFILAWGGAAFAASFVGVLLSRHWPAPHLAVSWIREQWSLTRYLVPEFVILQAGNQVATLLVALALGEAAAGAMRGGNLLTAPVAILGAGITSFAVPELARRRARMTARTWYLASGGLGGVVLVAGVAWGSMFLLLPDAFGQTVLRDSWEGTRSVLVPVIVGQAATALAGGPTAALYAMGRAQATFRVHLLLAALVLVLPISFALLWGLPGAAWGIAASFWAVVPFWWISLRRAVAAEVEEQREARPTASTVQETTA